MFPREAFASMLRKELLDMRRSRHVGQAHRPATALTIPAIERLGVLRIAEFEAEPSRVLELHRGKHNQRSRGFLAPEQIPMELLLGATHGVEQP